jgi:hypothetical protein
MTDACAKHDHTNSPGEAAQRDEAAEDIGKHDRGFPAGGHEWDRER